MEGVVVHDASDARRAVASAGRRHRLINTARSSTASPSCTAVARRSQPTSPRSMCCRARPCRAWRWGSGVPPLRHRRCPCAGALSRPASPTSPYDGTVASAPCTARLGSTRRARCRRRTHQVHWAALRQPAKRASNAYITCQSRDRLAQVTHRLHANHEPRSRAYI